MQLQAASRQRDKQELLLQSLKREMRTNEQKEIEAIARNDPNLSQIQSDFYKSSTQLNKNSLSDLIERVETAESPDQTQKFLRTKNRMLGNLKLRLVKSKAKDLADECKRENNEIRKDLMLFENLRQSATEKHESFSFVQESLKDFDNVTGSFLPKFVKLHA